jgi:hypothetical protein
MAERQDFKVYRGDDQPVRWTLTTNGSIAGSTFRFTARATSQSTGTPALQKDGSPVDNGSTTTPGIVEVLLTRAELLALVVGQYAYALRRTNGGSAATFAYGTMTVRPDVEDAPA